ncbi:MAG: hypothetical protein HUJ42_01410 [Malacoplasma sp.]|nr:hypothetical protein [Malacoplasma sp.]
MKKSKKWFFKLNALAALVAIPTIVTSCSVSPTLIKNSYLTSNSNGMLTSNLSLSDVSTAALKTDSGMKGFLEQIANKIAYNWLLNLANTNADDGYYAKLLENKQKQINTSYDDNLKSYQQKYGDNWQLKFQQEVLDQNGGNKQDYINNQLYSFAKSTLTDKLFSTLYLSVYNKSSKTIVYNPDASQILAALKNTAKVSSTTTGSDANLVYKFDSRMNLLAKPDSQVDNDFAAFQDYIFQKYVEYENPYIVDYASWNYNTPNTPNNINDYYNVLANTSASDSENSGSTNSGDNSGSESTDSGSSTSGSTDSGSTGGTSGSTSTNSFRFTKNASILKTKSSLQDASTDSTDSTSSTDNSSGGDSSSDSSGDSSSSSGSDSSSTSTSSAATYYYPYFGNENATNTTSGTLLKFENFVTGTNINNYISDTDTGIRKIPLTLSDDTNTLKLVKNSTLFSDQDVPTAAAIAYLYGTIPFTASSGTTKNPQLTNINTQITHNINLSTTTNGLDPLTAQFISTSNLYTSNGSGSTSDNNATISPLQLSGSYIDNVINKVKLSDLSGKTVYTIDNFVPGTITSSSNTSATQGSQASASTSSPLSDFMFFRTNNGVSAAAIDGKTLIGKATNVADKKTDAALVVLYRYLLGKYTSTDFTIDLSNELSSFFSSNTDWLIYEFAQTPTFNLIDGETYTNKMFSTTSIADANSINLATSIANYLQNAAYYDKSTSAAQSMYENKKPLNQNYGYTVYKNGLASSFDYKYVSDNNTEKYYGISSNYLFENALLASTGINPFTTTISVVNVNNSTLANNTSLYQSVVNAIPNVINNLQVQSGDYSQYSQYVFSNNYFVNAALTNTLSDSSFIKSLAQNKVLSTYIGSFYTPINGSTINSFSLSKNPFNSTADTTATTDIQTYLQNAMYNFFYLNSLSAQTDMLFNFGATSSVNANSVTNGITDIRKYSFDLWNMNNTTNYASQLTNYNSLYTTIAIIKYLLDDNLVSFLKYMQNYIGNDNAYVIWQNSQNSNVQALAKTASSGTDATSQTYTTPTSQSLLTGSIVANINNNTYGAYVGNKPTTADTITTPLTYNLDSGALYQSDVNNKYYSATGDSSNNNNLMYGFLGLQTKSTNVLPTDLNNALFVNSANTNINLTGCLYQYGNSANLISYLNNIVNMDNLSTFASTLDNLTNFIYGFANSIDNSNYSLNQKKEILIAAINKLPANYYQQFKDYVGVSNTTTASGSSATTTISAFSENENNVNKYGAYAYQLNRDSFNSLASLQTALGATSNNADSYKKADEIICNLLVQYVTSIATQSDFINQIVKDSRISVYDIRAYNAFSDVGINWVNNYKTINN